MRRFSRWFFIILLFTATTVTADIGGISPGTLMRVERQFGHAAKQRVLAWQELIRSEKRSHDSEWEMIHVVNAFFNRLPFVSDIKHWHIADYWATPIEFLASNGGDCEDFSIAKYFTLRALGVPDKRLRMIYVKALRLNQAHMVLAYYESPGSEPLILDSLIPQIELAYERTDLLPIYSFNGKNLWMSRQRQKGRRIAGGSQRISLWRGLNIRMEQERVRGYSFTIPKIVK